MKPDKLPRPYRMENAVPFFTNLKCHAYIHEVGQPFHGQLGGPGAARCPGPPRLTPQLLQRHPIVAHQAAEASGPVKRHSATTSRTCHRARVQTRPARARARTP
ncbi:hypothetical protein EYF80_048874 [Liparis tanakae]|uniref:Uncharacterized protein n=1 Tax=Liparis tanakae TaxID=230148 RepID=A0A4Z2FJK3_9TELE|nr:hypothetical protein EYF80_048874 [Liparis tanakae]